MAIRNRNHKYPAGIYIIYILSFGRQTQTYTQLAPNLKCQDCHYWHCFSQAIELGFEPWPKDSAFHFLLPHPFWHSDKTRRQRVPHLGLPFVLILHLQVGGGRKPTHIWVLSLCLFYFPFRCAQLTLLFFCDTTFTLTLTFTFTPARLLFSSGLSSLLSPGTCLLCTEKPPKPPIPGSGLLLRFYGLHELPFLGASDFLRHSRNFCVVPALMNRPTFP